MGDASLPITRADLDAQNRQIDDLTTQIGEIRQLLLQIVGHNGGNNNELNVNADGRRGNNRRPTVGESGSESNDVLENMPRNHNRRN